MRSGEDEDTALPSWRLREVLLGVLAAIVVIGAVLPWLALVDAWQAVGRDDFFPASARAAMPRLVIALQSVPYLSLPSGNHAVLAMVPAVGVILLSRGRPRESHDGMRWSPALVVTGSRRSSRCSLLWSGWSWAHTPGSASSTSGSSSTFCHRAGSVASLPSDDVTEPVGEPTGQRRGQGSQEQHEAPVRPVGPSDIRADGASDSGYDEFRFRR